MRKEESDLKRFKTAITYIPLIIICTIIIIINWRWCQNPDITTFILVRHAEKANNSQNTPLSQQGFIRAEALSYALRNTSVDAIYATQYDRTQQTIAEIAEEENIDFIEYNATSDSIQVRIFLENILENRRGERILIAGHSNTIPIMLNILEGTSNYTTIDENIFDNLFISPAISISNNDIYHLKYGEPSE